MTQSESPTASTMIAQRRPKRSLPSSVEAFSSRLDPTPVPSRQDEQPTTRKQHHRARPFFAMGLIVSLLLVFSAPASAKKSAKVQHDEVKDFGVLVQKYEEEFLVDFDQPSWVIRQDVVKAVDEIKGAYNSLVSSRDPYRRKMVDVEVIGIVDKFGNFVELDLFQKRRMLRTAPGRSLRGESLRLRLMTAANCYGCLRADLPMTKNGHYRHRSLQADANDGIPSTQELLVEHDDRIKKTPNKFPSIHSAIDLQAIAMRLTAVAEEAAANADVKAEHAKVLRNYAIREERRVEKELEGPVARMKKLKEKLAELREQHASGQAQVLDKMTEVNKDIQAIENDLAVAQSRLAQLRNRARKAERQADQAHRRARQMLRRAKEALEEAVEAEAIAEAKATKIATRLAAAEAMASNKQQGNDADRKM